VSPNQTPTPGSCRHRRRRAVSSGTERPGSLTVVPPSGSVSAPQVRAFGFAEPGEARSVSIITVNETRGSLVSWRATVSVQTVSGLDAAQLASTRLCVSPHPTTFVAGDPADVVRSSPRACAGPGDPTRTLPAGAMASCPPL